MATQSRSGLTPWFAWSLIVVLFDQITKILIVGYYQLGQVQEFTGFFNLVRAHNPGAAFSFLRDAGGWQRWLFSAVAVIAVVVMVWMLRKHAGQKLFAFAIASILGGAVGNLIDRLRLGYVVDFLDFHWGAAHFPAFNVADSAISLGAACLILDELLRVRRAR